MSTPSLFIWVQHLFGKGHVRRMARIAAACAQSGMEVTVVAGGPEGREAFAGIDGVTAHQLPSLATSNHQYTGLLSARGEAPDEAYWQMRRCAMLETLATSAPGIVLIELFPFGRRKFAAEVLALIEAARALPTAPLIISSVRDIIEPKAEPTKMAEMGERLADHFDAVLVHGDKDIIGLEETAPFVAGAGAPLHYTGYIAPSPPQLSSKSGVVVSAGSSPSGEVLLGVAVETGDKSATIDAPWHIFVPPDLDEPAPKNAQVHVHPFGADFMDHLARAEISISEAGYNTVAEAVALGTKPVLVPYAEAGQTEQGLRATRFSERGLAIALSTESLNPAGLIKAVNAARDLSKAPALNLSGTSNVPVILKGLRGTTAAS